jgi:hypothetical protein
MRYAHTPLRGFWGAGHCERQFEERKEAEVISSGNLASYDPMREAWGQVTLSIADHQGSPFLKVVAIEQVVSVRVL